MVPACRAQWCPPAARRPPPGQGTGREQATVTPPLLPGAAARAAGPSTVMRRWRHS